MFAFTLLDLTLGEILSDIPHDVGAMVVYILIAVLVGFIVIGGRNKPPPTTLSDAEPGQGRPAEADRRE